MAIIHQLLEGTPPPFPQWRWPPQCFRPPGWFQVLSQDPASSISPLWPKIQLRLCSRIMDLGIVSFLCGFYAHIVLLSVYYSLFIEESSFIAFDACFVLSYFDAFLHKMKKKILDVFKGLCKMFKKNIFPRTILKKYDFMGTSFHCIVINHYKRHYNKYSASFISLLTSKSVFQRSLAPQMPQYHSAYNCRPNIDT